MSISARAYRLWLAVSYLLGMGIILLQPLRHVFSDAFTGMLPYRGSDESLYIIRLQEALLSPTADATAGIWGGDLATTGMQMALMERVAGWLFGWTGLDATWVVLIITALAAPSTILLTAALLRRVGSSRLQTLLLAVGYFILMGYFRRVFNTSLSMPILMVTLLFVWRWWDHLRLRDAIGAGVCLGLISGVYFWAWTYSWAVFGLLFVCVFEARRQPDFARRVQTSLLIVLLTVICSAPILWQMYQVQHHPIFPEASIRMGLLYSREFESLPRSILLALLSGGTLWAMRSEPNRLRYAPLVAMVVGCLVVMHQQFIHGRIMSFSSHYYMFVCLAALLATAFVLSHWKKEPGRYAILLSSFVLLSAAFHDYDVKLSMLRAPSEWSISFRHLAPVIRLLNESGTETILTSRETADTIASTTNDHVVFTDYSKILLVSTEERAQRYCLSEALGTGPIDTGFLAFFDEEQSRGGRAQTAWLYERHLQITADACAWVMEDLPRALRKFEVDAVLWNHDERPEWDTNRSFLRVREEGDRWTLYDVVL